MKFHGMTIPLKTLVEQLHLSADQIKELTMHRMKHSDTNFQIKQTQSILTKGQSCDIFRDLLTKKGHGFVVDPKKRVQVGAGKKKCYVSSICGACLCGITTHPSIVVYACGHEFHSHCLKATQEKQNCDSCPLCFKQDYTKIRAEIEKESERQLGAALAADDDEEEETKDDPSRNRGYSMFNQEDDDDHMAKFHMEMMRKKFDQFDVEVEDRDLILQEFLDAQAD